MCRRRRDLAEIVRADVAAKGWPVYEVSAVSREGLAALTFGLAGLVARAPGRAARGRADPHRAAPAARSTTPGSPSRSDPDGTYVVRGAKPERWVRQTNFDNDEAVGYLADRLARLGVEERLAKMGAEPGCLVRIGTFEFDWQPTVYAGAEFTPGHRGVGLPARGETHRSTAAERLAARKSRRRPYELGEDPTTGESPRLWMERTDPDHPAGVACG